jgi:H+/Cl- antiporter ClcA
VRWKLIIITSLVAALVNAGGMHALVYSMNAYLRPLSEQPYLLSGLIAIPLAVATLASIFVYRHTARRRKLQAMLTALISFILTAAALLIIAQILPRRPLEIPLTFGHPAIRSGLN